jgi:hypothetical protein
VKSKTRWQRVSRRGTEPTGHTLAFAADICVRATEYEVDGLLFFKNHFEGVYLFRDMVTLEATPPLTPDGDWRIEYQFANQREQPKLATVKECADVLTLRAGRINDDSMRARRQARVGAARGQSA